VFLID